RRDSFLRHAVHLFGANLDFEAGTVVGDHRRVQRLIEIWTRHGNEVFDSTWHWTPDIVHDAEHAVTVLHRTRDHAHGVEVIHLVHGNALFEELLVNAVKALDATLDRRRNSSLFEFVA